MAVDRTVRTFTDSQLGDIREAINKFGDIRCERNAIVHSAAVEIEGGEVVNLHYDCIREQFVVDL